MPALTLNAHVHKPLIPFIQKEKRTNDRVMPLTQINPFPFAALMHFYFFDHWHDAGGNGA